VFCRNKAPPNTTAPICRPHTAGSTNTGADTRPTNYFTLPRNSAICRRIYTGKDFWITTTLCPRPSRFYVSCRVHPTPNASYICTSWARSHRFGLVSSGYRNIWARGQGGWLNKKTCTATATCLRGLPVVGRGGKGLPVATHVGNLLGSPVGLGVQGGLGGWLPTWGSPMGSPVLAPMGWCG
jgi:hypothetical protein